MLKKTTKACKISILKMEHRTPKKIQNESNKIKGTKDLRKKNHTFICLSFPLSIEIIASASDRFANKDLGVLLDLQRKSKTLLTSVLISGLLADLLETKLSIVFRIPSITYENPHNAKFIENFV
jgi:hypothetical protein